MPRKARAWCEMHRLIEIYARLRRSEFLRNLAVVMSGTALSQVIGFLLMPVISRLFTPEHFGVWGAYNSILCVAAAGVTLQYSQAVMLPRANDAASGVFWASVMSVLMVTGVCLLIVLVFPGWVLGLMGSPGSWWLLVLLPAGICANGLYQAFQAWCIRRMSFRLTAASQLVYAGTLNAVQFVLGLVRAGGFGLVAGVVAGYLFSALTLARQIRDDWKTLKGAIGRDRIRKAACEYRDFPAYSATQNTMNALSQGIPVLLLTNYYGIAVAGAYAFGLRVLQVPMHFILTSLRQVLFQKASATYNASGKLMPLFARLTFALAALAAAPAIILFVWSPQIFSLIFGADWRQAGEYARWLVMWLVPAFCNVPSVILARILRLQRYLLLYDIGQLVLRVAVLVLGGMYMDPLETIIGFSFVGLVMNTFLIAGVAYVLANVENVAESECLP